MARWQTWSCVSIALAISACDVEGGGLFEPGMDPMGAAPVGTLGSPAGASVDELGTQTGDDGSSASAGASQGGPAMPGAGGAAAGVGGASSAGGASAGGTSASGGSGGGGIAGGSPDAGTSDAGTEQDAASLVDSGVD